MDIAIQANISNTNNSNNKIEKKSFSSIKTNNKSIEDIPNDNKELTKNSLIINKKIRDYNKK